MLVAAPFGGRLEKRYVNRGQEVAAGAPLFALEQENEKAARREAEERVRNAEAKLANIAAGQAQARNRRGDGAGGAGRRCARALRAPAEAAEALYDKGFLLGGGMDTARAHYDRDIARVAEMEAQIRLARMAIGRDKEIAAARPRSRRRARCWRKATGACSSARVVGAGQGTGARHPVFGGRVGGRRQSGGEPAAARQPEDALLRARDRGRRAEAGPGGARRLRRMQRADSGEDQLHLAPGGVHAAGDLQPRAAREAGVPGRGAARARRRGRAQARATSGCFR